MLERLKVPAKIATVFLVAWFISFPVTVHALGFGNIKMKSALNQPLVAEIELFSATPDEVKILEVKLASNEAFLRAGVDRSVLLSRIKFNVVKRGGKYYINLRTRETVREPFLNFLLELNWKNGRIIREYTVLLDPPDRIQNRRVAKAVEPTPAETFIAPAPEPAPEPVALAPEPEPILVEPEPAPVAAVEESPFLGEPVPVEQSAQADEGLFPYTPIDQAPQVPDESPVVEPIPEPTPEPVLEPAPEPIALAPEPIELEPEPAPLETPSSQAEPPEEPAFQTEEEGLFPEIPLQKYSGSDNQVAEAPEPTPVGESEPSEAPYEPVGELDYGITQKGDNAWNIALKLKPSNQISVYQVMMALQQSNPSAFVDGNIHRLKEGQVLRIDDASLLTAISKEQAAEQYQLQTRVWEDYVTSVGGEVPRQPIVAGADTSRDESFGEPRGEVTIESITGDNPAGTGGEATGGDVALLREEVRQAMSEASQERTKNSNLTRKLDELEQSLARLQNLVTVKDSDLAALRAQLEAMNAQQKADAGQDLAQIDPRPEPVVIEPEPVAIEPEPVVIEPEPVAIEPEPVEIEPIEPELDPVEPSPLEPDAVVDPVEPDRVVTPTGDSGFMGTITTMMSGFMAAGTMLYIIFGVVGVIILALVVMIFMRRRSEGVNFQESILTGGPKDDFDSVAMDASPSQGSSLMGGESSFLSDFAISGVSAIQAEDSEVDPLTEADVFMAYGRYEAAEERLQEAISQDPARGELRVKLLELFSTTKNKTGFESSAEEFYATLGGGAESDPLWQKVVSMGSEIAPGNPMFSGEGMPQADTDLMPDTPSIDGSQVMDIGLDTGVFSNSELNGPDPTVVRPKPTEEIDLTGATDTIVPGYSSDDNATQDSIDISDLDLSLDGDTADITSTDGDDLDFSLSAEDGGAEIEMPASEDLSFDLLSEGDESTVPTDGDLDFTLDETPVVDTQTEADSELEFNLDLDTDNEPTAVDIKLDLSESETSDGSAPTGGLDFDLNIEEDLSDISSVGMDMNLDAGDAIDLDMPAGTDEIGTKLDLARAYIDMGDPDGARSILDEVIDEGDDGQKQEAEQLMTQIG